MGDANSDGVARMLDSLMDRVDRLENSGESEAAIATFIEATERAASRDEGEVLGPELDEAAVAADDAAVVVDVEMPDASVATDDSLVEVTIEHVDEDVAVGTDASSVQGRVVARLRWNERSWNTSTWSGDDVDAIEPATGEDTGVASDDGAVGPAVDQREVLVAVDDVDISALAETETSVATDDAAVQGRDINQLVWNSRTWNTSTWS